jgi:hypothetical protein
MGIRIGLEAKKIALTFANQEKRVDVKCNKHVFGLNKITVNHN